MVYSHKTTDRRANREKGNATRDEYLSILLKYNMKCAVSHIRLTIQKNLPTDVSFDRLDNKLPHTVDNLRPIAFVFQTVGKRQVSRKQFLHMCLIQQFHPIPNQDIFTRIHSEHDSLNEHCAFCAIDGSKLEFEG
jgi:hypothetical protein